MQRTYSTILALTSRRASTHVFASSAPSSQVVALASRRFAEATPNKGGEAKEPSMLVGHAHYVTGAVKETVGSVIGSETMKKAGQEAKDAGVAEMKAAYHGQDNWMSPELEKKLGKAIGCEGMAEKGEEKLRKKHDDQL